MIKKDMKPEVKTLKPKKQSLSLTPEEKSILERVRADTGREWENITEESIDDFSLSEMPGKLPEWAQKLKDEKKYAFRWVTRKKERLDEIRGYPIPRKWWIVNISSFSQAEDSIDPVLGCVTYLDQMLMFKPYWMFAKEQAYKQTLAESKDQAGDINKRKGMVDEGYEWDAGSRAKIGKMDEVQADESEFLPGEEGPTSGDEDFGELTTKD